MSGSTISSSVIQALISSSLAKSQANGGDGATPDLSSLGLDASALARRSNAGLYDSALGLGDGGPGNFLTQLVGGDLAKMLWDKGGNPFDQTYNLNASQASTGIDGMQTTTQLLNQYQGNGRAALNTFLYGNPLGSPKMQGTAGGASATNPAAGLIGLILILALKAKKDKTTDTKTATHQGFVTNGDPPKTDTTKGSTKNDTKTDKIKDQTNTDNKTNIQDPKTDSKTVDPEKHKQTAAI